MDVVYVVHHDRLDLKLNRDAKLVGIYTSPEAADQAILRFKIRPEFRDFPDDFTINVYALDRDHWANSDD